MNKHIPSPLVAIVSDMVSFHETHASLDSLFMYAEAPGEPPEGSKHVKAQEWLRYTNKVHPEPLSVLGKIICGYMEDPLMAADYKVPEWTREDEQTVKKRENVRKIEAVLAKNGFQYRLGGVITSGGMAPSKTLGELIKGRDMPAIHREFDRAMETVEGKPRDAVSAASNILESIFKTYIEDNNLPMPDKQDLQPVFKVVRADLGLEPGSVEDQDLQRIISGIFSIVDGIGALRTHAGSAHSEGRKGYKLEPRHARLAVNSAHTIATFVMETWDKKMQKNLNRMESN
ncbi:MAG: abortive infection family protein [Polaromonas sp.]|uniref:abortive infection family protein n=1 Tax=Polaromonas sp. TaxID=1869339 RepID=UPI00271B29E5|nr:abortive infection family protein [Polaromonas sp.]MDO9113071.1 abortive infection family protein [Polaromonas sp.]MDP1887435.1 abortive infection family protein [Polaromonas sp.]